MSEHSTAIETSSPELTAEPEFSPEEVKQFTHDDSEAGKVIGKMLSSLFLYTVLAMVVSALVTYYWISNPSLS